MKTHRDTWNKIKQDKVVRIELRVSFVDTIRARSIKAFRRALTKQKDKDDNYKRANPHAKLTSTLIDYNQDTNILLMEFNLFEPTQSVEDL